ncbi:MAG: hypothetical protein ACR2P6_00890 [Gammaproteobacteria bacterium]
MLFPSSAIHVPRTDWADTLRARALQVPSTAMDERACLDAFRRHDAFYAGRLADVSGWHGIPPLQKIELAAVPVTTTDELHETRSSGTSGTQAVVRNTLRERRFRQALAYRPFLFYPLVPESGKEIRQVIFVDGNAIEAVDKSQWPFEFGGHAFLTWHVGIAAAPAAIHALLQAVKPQVLRGLTSGLIRFAEQAAQPLQDLGVQVVSPSGEQLTDAWRHTLEAAFAAPVLDRYGATETGSLAWQCPYCDAYHVNSDEIIVESNEQGVLATPLFIESQPLLRYQLEDRIELAAAPSDCRIGLPVMKILAARRDDWIIDGAGLKVSPLSFQFEQIAGLKAWQLHQLSSGTLRLYVDSERPLATIREQLTAQLHNIVAGRDCELVEGVWSAERGGKFKRVTSAFSR